MIYVNHELIFSVIRKLSREYVRRNTAHVHIAARLHQTSKLPGFTGSLDTGIRIGRDPSINEGIPPPPWVRVLNALQDTVENHESEVTAVESNDVDDNDLHGIEDESDAMAQLVDTLLS